MVGIKRMQGPTQMLISHQQPPRSIGKLGKGPGRWMLTRSEIDFAEAECEIAAAVRNAYNRGEGLLGHR